MEEFRNIPGYEGLYQVSNFGRVKSFRGLKEKILNLNKQHGYLKTSLRKDGKQRNFSIHQLVAMAFLGHIPCGHKSIVNHINKNKLDNRVENLKIIFIKKQIS